MLEMIQNDVYLALHKDKSLIMSVLETSSDETDVVRMVLI